MGSTEIATRVDPEEWRALLHVYFSEMSQPIQRYGGTIEKFIGDAIFAVFGVPRAHEDDAERAVRAAVGMQGGLAGLNPAFERRLGMPLRLRIGVATGEVVAPHDVEWDQPIVGDLTALAERLETQAPANGIVLSERTYRLVAPLVEAESLGALALKGFPAPERAYLVRRLRIGPERPLGAAAPLVGRDEELEGLLGARDRLEAGQGRVVVIIGEAGLGKSRLVGELRARFGTGMLLLQGRCHEFAQATAYRVFVQHLLDYLGLEEDEPRDVGRLQLRTRLYQVFGSPPPDVQQALEHLLGLDTSREFEAAIQGLEPEEIRGRVVRAIVAFWEAVAARQPLLLLIEDLHWVDPASARVLAEIVPISERVPLMLLCTFRPERRSLAWEFKNTTERDYPHCYHELRLKPLSATQTEHLAGVLLEGLGLPVDLKRTVAQRADGNPFYVEEMVRSLHEQGSATTPAAKLPDTLQGVLQARLQGLPPSTRRVLQAAAVIGRSFSLRLLAPICGLNGELVSHLSVLQRTDFVHEQQRLPDLRFSFKHVLLQEAVYQTLLRKDRCDFHRRVAARLEQESSDVLSLPILVHHCLHGEDWPKAFALAARAGDAAQSLAALEVALEQYDIALRVARDHPESITERATVLQVQEARGAILSFLSRYEEAETHFEQLLAEDQPAKVKARFHRHIGRVKSLAGDLWKAEASLTRALRLLEGDPDPEAEVGTFRDLAHIMERRRNFPKALDYAQRSLQLAVQHALRPQMRDIYHVLAITHLFGGDPAEASRYAADSLSLALEDNDQLGIVRSRNDLAQVLLFTGDPQQALVYAQEAQALANKLNIWMPLAQTEHTLAEIYLDQGRWEEAGRILASVEDLIRRYKLGVALEALVQREQGFVGLAQSHWDEALHRLDAARALEKRTGIARHLPKIYRGLAEAHLGLREFSHARDNAARARTYERGGNLFETPAALRVLAAIAREKGELRRAFVLLRKSRALLERRNRSIEYAKVLFEIARAHAKAGHRKEVEETVNESLKVCAAMGAPSLVEAARHLAEQLRGED